MNFPKELIYYIAVLNFISFILMFIDKRKAIKGNYRIPEKTLLGAAAIGGSFGLWIGMYVFHHKTKKKLFTIGVPAIAIIQIFSVYWFKLIQV